MIARKECRQHLETTKWYAARDSKHLVASDLATVDRTIPTLSQSLVMVRVEVSEEEGCAVRNGSV